MIVLLENDKPQLILLQQQDLTEYMIVLLTRFVIIYYALATIPGER